MTIDIASMDQVYDVALSMREHDYAEFSATSRTTTRQALAEELAMRSVSYGNAVLCARKKGVGAVAIGAPLEIRPNVLTLLFFATSDFPKIALDMTRFITKRLFPPMIKAGVHRIECVSLDSHAEAHRWISLLGLSRETGPLRRYGKNGETFYQFAWTSDVRPYRG